MGQTASSPTDTTPPGGRDVKRQRRHSSQASASEKMESGPKRVSSRHSRTESGSSSNHGRKRCHDLCPPHGGGSAMLPRKKSTRSSPSTAHPPNPFQADSKDSASPGERRRRRKPNMYPSAHLQTPKAATRLIKRRDKAVFEVQSALQMLAKYGTGDETDVVHLSVEDLRRLEEGFKRVRDLLGYIAAKVEPRVAGKILAYNMVLVHNTFSDLRRTRAMLRHMRRDLEMVRTHTSATKFKASPKMPQPSSGPSRPAMGTHDRKVKSLIKTSSTSESIISTLSNDLDLYPESWYLGSEASHRPIITGQSGSQFILSADASTMVKNTSATASHLAESIYNRIDLTPPEEAITGNEGDGEVSKGLREKVVRFRRLASGNVDYPRSPSASKPARGKGKAKEEDENLASKDLKKRLSALRESTATTASSVNFSRPLVSPSVLTPPMPGHNRQPLTERRNAWAGNLPSPSLNEIIKYGKQATSEQKTPIKPNTKFSLTVLPALTDVASYMQLFDVDIIEFAVVDASRKPTKGFTWTTSAPSQTMKTNDAECITIVRNHAAEKLHADPRAICLWFTTVSGDHIEVEPRNITTLSKQRVNIFLDPYIRLVVGDTMHAVDYSKRMTAEKIPVNRACVTVGELRKRAETQLNIHRKQRFKLSYQGKILQDGNVQLKEACSLTRRVLEGWDPLYISVEIETKRDCVVCGDELSVSRFSLRPITYNCDHECNSCRKCVREWIKSSLKNNGPDKLKCTECPAVLQHADVKAHASSRQFEIYDTFLTRFVVNADPDFHWCISTSCNSGHSHISTTSGPIFTCASCNLRQCVHHKTPWHIGETCEQYDYRISSTARWKEEEKASEKTIKETTKPCGKCKASIEKNDGCDHMTCRKCRYEFCWVCLVDYEPIRRVGNSMHDARCLHYRGMPTVPPVPRRR